MKKHTLACELAILSRSNEYAIPAIREAYSRFPANQLFYELQSASDFTKSQQILCISAFSNVPLSTNTLEADLHPNILAAYEKIGNSSWNFVY